MTTTTTRLTGPHFKLTDAHLVILGHATRRPGGRVLPLPEAVGDKGGAGTRALKALLRRGLVQEEIARPEDCEWGRAENGARLTLMITPAGRTAIAAGADGQGSDASAAEPSAESAAPVSGAELPTGPDPQVAAQSAPNPAETVASQVAETLAPQLTPQFDPPLAPMSAQTLTPQFAQTHAPQVISQGNEEFTASNSESVNAARAGTKGAALVGLLRREEGATLTELMAVSGWQAHSVRGFLSGALRKKFGLTVASGKADGVRRYTIAA